MAYRLSQRSEKALVGVHPDLVACVRRALELTTQDFTVVEGLRTLERQRELVAKGASKTLKSRHLKQQDGYGHAVDIYPYYNRSVQVDAPFSRFRDISRAMKQAAGELGILITWGGDWKSFVDSPHYQLERGR
jgi:peptidoglycan L-alanyl-D-glutamate endopeptidase CwlK